MAVYSRALGDNVFRKRKQLGMTQAELAERIGATEQTVRKIEHYNANPQMDVLFALIRTLEIDPTVIFFPEKEPESPVRDQIRNMLSDADEHELEALIPIIAASLELLRKTRGDRR